MFKIAFVLVFAISFAEVLSKNDLNIKDLIHFKRVFEGEKCKPFENIINKPVCDYSEEDWIQIKDCFMEYGRKSGEVNMNTGVFSLQVLSKFRSKKDMDIIIASICQEKYDEQKTVEFKILNVYKHAIRRFARCPDIKYFTCKESCRRDYPSDAEFESNNPCKFNA